MPTRHEVTFAYRAKKDLLEARTGPGPVREVPLNGALTLLVGGGNQVAGFRIAALSEFADYLAVQDYLGVVTLGIVAELQAHWVDGNKNESARRDVTMCARPAVAARLQQLVTAPGPFLVSAGDFEALCDDFAQQAAAAVLVGVLDA